MISNEDMKPIEHVLLHAICYTRRYTEVFHKNLASVY